MWASRSWVGRYFPPDTRSGEELAAYARFCNAVEANTTFYGLPGANTVARWADQSPADFRFLFKLPRQVTHELRLRDGQKEVAELCRRLEPLGARVGALFVQLPASFGPEQLPMLDRFLAEMPHDHHRVVEVRHPAFSAGHSAGPDSPGLHSAERALNDVLHRYAADRAVLDSRALFAGPAETPEELAAFKAKPRLPVRAVAISQHPVVRFVGQTQAGANPPFWARWVETVVRWLADGRQPYFFLHTPDNEVSPELARLFHEAVAARLPELVPLPAQDEPVRTEKAQPALW